jgi:hypothetical protein
VWFWKTEEKIQEFKVALSNGQFRLAQAGRKEWEAGWSPWVYHPVFSFPFIHPFPRFFFPAFFLLFQFPFRQLLLWAAGGGRMIVRAARTVCGAAPGPDAGHLPEHARRKGETFKNISD